ncbi:hypothetical protein B0T18DRAFT_402558 [Schizothecium vesticola]|uniref:Uncharacterized protein n=1 Tax=Schizothecium vesticola TaxID=314040 RepID=A0AA40F5A2_9PEZI|nr:hypothetical protein B0T18DRAFT_402558 [Schizothecium vesticola]
MLRTHLGIDESSIMGSDAPERLRDAKWLRSRRRHLLQELSVANWEPGRLGWFRMWRPDEVESEWIQRFYSHLFLRLNEFVSVNFGHGNIDTMGAPIWATGGFPKHFVHYAQLVARQDNHTGGWDWLLHSGRQRVYLIVGIIGKMLQTHVFDDLLFGGEDSAKAILQSQDEGLLTVEGYQRTDLRGRTVKAILGDGNLPVKFWDAVDVLTTKIATTLLPLVDLIDEHFPEYRDVSLRGFYQDLHYIVAEAGFFSLTLRESKDIFHFTWPFPGQAWDLDQDNHDNEVYKISLQENKRLHAEQQRQQQEQQQQQEEHSDSDSDVFVTPRSSASLPSATAKPVQFLQNLKKGVRFIKAPAAPPPADLGAQIAKVHICLWPMLQRFSTPTPQWEEPPSRRRDLYPDPGHQYITEIARARVVYYLGSTNPNAEQAERHPTLAQHINSHRSRFSLSRLPIPRISRAVIRHAAWVVLGLLAVLAAAAWFSPLARGILITLLGYLARAIDRALSGLAPYLYKAVVLFGRFIWNLLYGISLALSTVERAVWRVWHVLGAVFRAARDAATDREQPPPPPPQQPTPTRRWGGYRAKRVN